MQLYRAGHFHLPIGLQPDLPTRSQWDGAFLRLLESGGPDLDRPLKSLYSEVDE
jgi:hypothetical protein